MALRFNNDAGNDYNYQYGEFDGAGVTAADDGGVMANAGPCGAIPAANADVGSFGGGTIDIPGYTSAASFKFWNGLATSRYSTTANTGPVFTTGGQWNQVPAINRVTLLPQSGGNFVAGSVASLYGL